jgi:protein-disulfide isomerase
MKRTLPFVIIGVVLVLGLGTVWYLQRSTAETPATSVAGIAAPPNNSAALATGPSAAPASAPAAAPAAVAEPGAQPAHALGNASAPVTLEEFGDFQCPPCGMLHPILDGFAKEFGPSKLRIIFREYPLVPTHVHALAAARSAEAAGLQNKFWEMHDMIYEHQNDWNTAEDVRPIFSGYAKAIGLDVIQFERDVAGNTVEQRIFLDGKRAHALGVKGTPTVFLNGREVPFASLAPEKLKALINSELAAGK